jgi:hypothetical protein
VPVAEESVELFVANGAELEAELPYMDDEAPPEILDSGVVFKGPRLLDDTLEPVASGREAGDLAMMATELDVELVGNGANVELDGTDVPEGYTGSVGKIGLDFVFEWS